jgi:heme a synthase
LKCSFTPENNWCSHNTFVASIQGMNVQNYRPVIIWLLIGCLLMVVMVMIGGITRLTGSGLSITEWNIVTGTFPPVSEHDWETEFMKYKESPQFMLVNTHFGIHEFKQIYWWEYLHRLLGRVIGLIFVIPFVYFLIKRMIPKRILKYLILVFFLGGFQGFLGWYMVQSGLVDNPAVSHLRLAMHLVTAFITYGLTFWIALQLINEENKQLPAAQAISGLTGQLFGLIILQIIYGAFVAGLKAGNISNTFPLMDGHLIPPGLTSLNTLWQNLTENLIAVQFIHRMLAFIIVIMAVILWIKLGQIKAEKAVRQAVYLVLIAVLLQFTIGIFTILNFRTEPLFWGVFHQAGALLLFTTMIYLKFIVSGSMIGVKT